MLLLVGASLLSLLCAVQPWLLFSMASAELAITAGQPFSVTGNELTPLGIALSLAFLAVIAVIAISASKTRTLLFLLLMLLALASIASIIFVLVSPLESAQTQLTKLTGLSGIQALSSEVVSLAVTPWPIVTAICAVTVLALAIWGLATHAAWKANGQRYERARATSQDTAKPDRIDDWDDLSQGTDPTV